MKKLELFQCEICGEQYAIEDICKRCESNHIQLVMYEIILM